MLGRFAERADLRRAYPLRAMGHSFSRVLVHLVWSTWDRTTWVDRDVESVVREAVAAQGRRLECPLRGFGAASDHVHLLIELHRNVALSALVRALKGASAHDVTRGMPALMFRWQQGYAAFSVSERDPDAALEYVTNQRERHAAQRLEPLWESPGFAPENDG